MKNSPILCVLMILFSFNIAWGQQNSSTPVNPGDPGFREKFSHLDFGGKFYVLAVKDAVNNYYMADFTQLPDRFERVYFMNLVYKSGKIVSFDSDITRDRVWFLVSNKYSEKEAGAQFDQFRDETLKASINLTAEEKASWLLKNDKFN